MPAPDLARGAAIGRFTIVRLLGAGGMGQVYEARDPQLGRSVAVKLLRQGMTGGVGLRLLREAQALARVQHPNVVAVHELGAHDGHAFVAMELVDGESLERYLAHARPDWRGVVELYMQAARGLAAVHAAGLVHRDVKPANLFVDAAGRVRVGDFGLVRLADPRDSLAPDDATASGRRTASAVTVGDGEPTPVAGDGATSDDRFANARADASNGEGASGPGNAASGDTGNSGEGPSAREVSVAVASGDGGASARGNEASVAVASGDGGMSARGNEASVEHVSRDAGASSGNAPSVEDGGARARGANSARSSGERTPSRNGALDETRLADSAVPAGPDLLRADMTHAGTVLGTPLFMSPEQHLGNRVTPASDQFSLCVAMWRALFREHPFAGEGREIIEATLDGRRREYERGRVPRWLVRALDRGLAAEPGARHPSVDALVRVFERGVGRRRVAVIALAATLAVVVAFSAWRILSEMRRADREAAEVRRRADETTLARASELLSTDPTRALEQLARLSPGASEWRGARTVVADAFARGISRSHRFHGRVSELAFSASGARLAGLGDGVLHVWDMPGAGLRTVVQPGLATIAWAGEELVGADARGAFVRIDLATGVAHPIRQVPGAYRRIAIAPGGRHAVLVDERANAQLVALDTGRALAIAGQHPAWSADGKYLATSDFRLGTTGRINLATGDLSHATDRYAGRVAATEARTWLADEAGRVWVTSDLGPYRVHAQHEGVIAALVPLVDGRVATTSSRATERGPDTAITLADGNRHRTLALRGHVDEIDAVALAPDGTLASADRSGVLRLWKAAPRFTLGDGLEIATDAVYDPVRAELVVVHRGPELEVVNAATRATRRVFEIDTPPDTTLPARGPGRRSAKVDGEIVPERYYGRDATSVATSASADRRRILTIDTAGRAILWDLDRSRGRMIAGATKSGLVCPDGKRALLVDADDAVRAWDLVAGTFEQLGTFEVLASACAPTGALAIARSTGAVYLVMGGAATELVETSGERVHALAFSSDGATLITGGDGRTVHAWDVATRTVRSRHDGHTAAVAHLAWLPDGRLASGAADGTVILWDLSGARERVELRGHTRALRSIAFRGERAVTTAMDHTARIWDLTGPIGRPLPGPDVHAAFAPDGSVITVDEHAYIDWFPDDDLPATEDGLRAWIAAHL